MPLINQIVTYSLSTDKNGKPCAVDVLMAGELLKKDRDKSGKSVFFIPTIYGYCQYLCFNK